MNTDGTDNPFPPDCANTRHHSSNENYFLLGISDKFLRDWNPGICRVEVTGKSPQRTQIWTLSGKTWSLVVHVLILCSQSALDLAKQTFMSRTIEKGTFWPELSAVLTRKSIIKGRNRLARIWLSTHGHSVLTVSLWERPKQLEPNSSAVSYTHLTLPTTAEV